MVRPAVTALLVAAFLAAVVFEIRASDGISVTATVAVAGKTGRQVDSSDVVVWLTPVDQSAARLTAPRTHPRILQHDKRFEPHLLVVPVGSVVDFPNLDPFFHNVFSLFDGKRFDLGLYEAGSSRSVSFSRTGVCYVFCNIHPDMSAVVVAVDTPYYAVSNAKGELSLPPVPPGHYGLSAWHERHKSEPANAFPREVTISAANASLGTLRFVESEQLILAHKNKYGRDYTTPPAFSPIYKK